ncbi:MAG: hypothetical protein ACFFDB_00365 [Promethearchaeota archaeon]
MPDEKIKDFEEELESIFGAEIQEDEKIKQLKKLIKNFKEEKKIDKSRSDELYWKIRYYETMIEYLEAEYENFLPEFNEELYSIFGIDTLKDKSHIKELKKEIKKLKKKQKKDKSKNQTCYWKLRFYEAMKEHLEKNYDTYYEALLEMHYDYLKEIEGAYDFLGINTKEDLDKYLFGAVVMKIDTQKLYTIEKKRGKKIVLTNIPKNKSLDKKA